MPDPMLCPRCGGRGVHFGCDRDPIRCRCMCHDTDGGHHAHPVVHPGKGGRPCWCKQGLVCPKGMEF